jgi:hypothetical protein
MNCVLINHILSSTLHDIKQCIMRLYIDKLKYDLFNMMQSYYTTHLLTNVDIDFISYRTKHMIIYCRYRPYFELKFDINKINISFECFTRQTGFHI